ncbi:phage tail protein [Actinobacillus equuli subsp. haemolyticus]|uniref:hypothetical protein n=1 Tax=Actinobacillus equuli TaxID=718 RepID=UPI00241889FF|nr:hypothetical protein [Actinobacillus equuli]MDG4947390.1 phage tail protein [Actinobacillus equuli subsp. haemolyticus]MDG4947413.1 phage tail protein [Actinobacillus equuli subsp. haemolyticus]MDG4949263.1 phage tail protein [Actinobacillus equuli subsp. haemolyticus]
MAGVKETATWENHVYQIEENDPVHGGADGVTNKPIKHLANRTLYLRKLLTEAGQRINPKKITATTKNSNDLTGHTHEIDKASLTTAGLVQLTNDTGLDSEALALTAKGAKALSQRIASLETTTPQKLNTKVDKTSISDAVDSNSQTNVASSKAAKIAYDKGVEALNAANAIKVGGRNLLLNSAVAYSGNGYGTRYELAEAPALGEDVVITVWGEIGADRTGIGVYNSQGYSSISDLKKIADGVYQGKGVWKKPVNNGQEVTPNNTHLNVYFYPRTGTSANTIHKIKLERGTIGTDWSVAPEDKVSMTGNETIKGVKTFEQSLENKNRIVVRRNDGIKYAPYHLLIDESIDLSGSLDAAKVIGQMHFSAGETGREDGRIRAIISTGVDVNKNGYFELGAYGNDNILRTGLKSFGDTGNVSIGKTTDNGNARLQVNGNIEATPPANNANNRLLPTTDWVRTNTANLVDARTAYLGGSIAMQDCKPSQLPQGAFFGVTSKNLAGTAQNGFTLFTKPWHNNSGHFASVRFGVFGNKFYYQSAKNSNEWNTELELATVPYVDGRFNQLIGAAPAALDTLQELAQALKNNTSVLDLYMLKADKSDAVNLDNSNKYATSKAVKAANDNANGRVSKNGDTINGVLHIKGGDYSQMNFWNTTGKQTRIETAPDSSSVFFAVSYKANNGSTNEHTVFFPKRGLNKQVAYEDWVSSNFNKKEIAVLMGVLEDGATIPLPAGFSESQCKWMLSINEDNPTNRAWDIDENESHAHYRFRCWANGRKVEARTYQGGHGKTPGTWIPARANYIVIGVK